MKSLIIFPVSLLIVLYVIIGMIVPKYNQAQTVREENKILEVQIEDQLVKLQKIQAFVAELSSYPGEVSFLNEYVPNNPLEQELISSIAQFGTTANVLVNGINMGGSTSAFSTDETGLGRLNTDLSITGSYDELLPFIDNIFRIKRLYGLSSLSISDSSDSTFNNEDDGQVNTSASDLRLNAKFEYIFIDNLPEVSVDDFTQKISFEEIAAVRDQTNPVNPIVAAPSERSNPFIP